MENTKKYIIQFLFVSLIIALVYSCANPVAPQGGPKDTTAPVVLSEEPPNYSTNFNSSKIYIYFDEYLTLKGLNQKLLISPPFEEKPDISLRGKSILIKLKEAPDSATTYVINFADAVADLNEGNVYKNLQYIFSTGDAIDSLELKGSVIDAFSSEAKKDINVMLYRDLYDSVPMKERPIYLTKTDASGRFKFTNLAGGNYKIIALEDGNSNYLFDLPTEMIAFADSNVQPYYNPASHRKHTLLNTTDSSFQNLDSLSVSDTVPIVAEKDNDSLQALTESLEQLDSLTMNQDSTAIDSLLKKENQLPQALKLRMFKEIDSSQKILEKQNYLNRKISIYLKNPVDSFAIELLDTAIVEQWYLPVINKAKDSIELWLPNYTRDTLKFVLKDRKTLIDTLTFSFFRLKFTDADSVLSISSASKNDVNLGRDLVLNFDRPVKQQFDTSYVFVADTDTSVVALKPIDTLGLRYGVTYPWNGGSTYKLSIPDSSFMDIYGNYNDSILFKFTAKSPEDYTGIKIILNSEYKDVNHIIQLLDDDNNVLRQGQGSAIDTLNFEQLPVQKYQIKCILDKNHNGKWDSGNYLYKIQPEQIFIYNKGIEGRGNWSIEETWEIKKP